MVDQFNEIAQEYDSQFTHTQIGKKQRALVHNHLENCLPNDSKWNILELNGGTGEDSVWLAKEGHKVLCTDISEGMIKIAKSKGKNSNLKYKILDINKLAEFNSKEKFDLIYSNFGGLNCLNPKQMEAFLDHSKEKLSKDGRLILVIMSKNCLWEKVFYGIKKDWKNANRKKSGFAEVRVGKEIVKTYYYNPKDILKNSKYTFRLNNIRPIGFFVPPSYLEPIFAKRKLLLTLFYKLDILFKSFAFLGKYSDHYLIELKRK